MKRLYFYVSMFLLGIVNNLQAQNDSIYFWKSGHLIDQRSIKSTDLDSITFTSQIKICNQVWTKRNLDVSTYRDGTTIPEVTNPADWMNLQTGAWCYYNNNPASETVYGKLYNWYAIAGVYDAASLNDPSLRKQFAPVGWHVPTDIEWTTLEDCLGGYAIAGGKMKEAGTTHWNSPNTNATNISSFTGLPGGVRGFLGDYLYIGNRGYWFSAGDGVIGSNYYYRTLTNTDGGISGNNGELIKGFSVRLVRD